MKNIVARFLISLFSINLHAPVYTETINEPDTKLCELLQYALIIGLSKTVNKVIENIYKNDNNVLENLIWASYGIEILKIKQIGGIGAD